METQGRVSVIDFQRIIIISHDKGIKIVVSENHKLQDKLELKKGLKMLGWVRFISKGIGVWPLEPNLYLNNVCLAYFTYIMITEYIAMFLCLPNLKKIVNLLAESLPFTQIYLRTLLLRIHIDKLSKVAGECMKDYRVSAFENPEEIYIFMGYIRKGKFYVKIGASFVFAASTSWFLRPITSSVPATTIIPGKIFLFLRYLFIYLFNYILVRRIGFVHLVH